MRRTPALAMAGAELALEATAHQLRSTAARSGFVAATISRIAVRSASVRCSNGSLRSTPFTTSAIRCKAPASPPPAARRTRRIDEVAQWVTEHSCGHVEVAQRAARRVAHGAPRELVDECWIAANGADERNRVDEQQRLHERLHRCRDPRAKSARRRGTSAVLRKRRLHVIAHARD